jgi:hypothetical protein
LIAAKSRDVGEVDIVVNNAGYFPRCADLCCWGRTWQTRRPTGEDARCEGGRPHFHVEVRIGQKHSAATMSQTSGTQLGPPPSEKQSEQREFRFTWIPAAILRRKPSLSSASRGSGSSLAFVQTSATRSPFENIAKMIEKNITLRGFNLEGSLHQVPQALSALFTLVGEGRLKFEIAKHPLSEAANVQRLFETCKTSGKLVLIP